MLSEGNRRRAVKLMACGLKPIAIANALRVTLDELRPVLWPEGKQATKVSAKPELLEKEKRRRGWKSWR